jgi:hypothetical protein
VHCKGQRESPRTHNGYHGFEKQFGNINLLHTNLVIVRTEIKFGKYLSAFKLIQKIINYCTQELILDSYFVESMKFGTHVGACIFGNKHSNQCNMDQREQHTPGKKEDQHNKGKRK